MDWQETVMSEDEIDKVTSPFVVPTNKQWRVKPDHRYWQDRRLANAQAQITGDIAYKAGIIKAISIYEPYIELLGQEIDTLSPLAIAHGWRSIRVEKGNQCREIIKAFKEELRQELKE